MKQKKARRNEVNRNKKNMHVDASKKRDKDQSKSANTKEETNEESN